MSQDNGGFVALPRETKKKLEKAYLKGLRHKYVEELGETGKFRHFFWCIYNDKGRST